MSFWKELSRRNVVKVGIAYAVAAWLIIHPVDIIFPILHLPEWSITLVAAILIILFPLILLFSWVYEVTPKGLKKTKDVPLSKSTTQLTGRKLNYIIIGLLVIAVAYLLFDKHFLNQRATEVKQNPAASTAVTAKKSIVVLPFKNMSSDKEQESFVDGLSEELINSITQIPDLRVIARTSSFVFKNSEKTAQEIGKALNVEYILEGSVRKAEKDLRITAQLISAADESHLWSKTFDKQLKDIFNIQEDIANAVANELKITLGIGKSFKQLGGTDNEKAYELYMIAKGRYWGGPDTIRLALESINAAIALDPKFALAWALKSRIYNGLSKDQTINQAASVITESLNAAQKAIELEPNLAAGYSSLGIMRTDIGDWSEAESAFRKVSELLIEPSSRYELEYSHHYAYVGDIKKAKTILQRQLQNDPLNGIYRATYIECLGFLGNRQDIEKEYEHGRELHGDQWAMNIIENLSVARLGSGNVRSRDELQYSSPIFDVAKNYLKSPKTGLAELHRIYNGDNVNCYYIAMWAAYFGDPEFAMDAFEKDFISWPTDSYGFWWPIMHEVRQTPRFKEFVRKIGLVDYWNKFGWPDMCHKLENGDFECD
jgi:adenylate cyclase